MVNRSRPPSKGEIAARPTSLSDDIFADRTVWQYTSDQQREPASDNRHRVNNSAKFYVVQLIGSWVSVYESAERVIRSRNNIRWVTFETKEYELRKAVAFKPFISRLIQGGCYAYIGGKTVETDKELKKIVEYPFIYICSAKALQTYNEMRKAKSARERSA